MPDPSLFIAIENAASMFGKKKKNTHMDAKTKEELRKIKGKDPLSRADTLARGNRHEQRNELVERLQVGLDGYEVDVDDSEDDLDYIIQGIRQNKPNAKIGRAGSLASLLARVKFEFQNGGRFNVLVLFGHGDAGMMSQGLGKLAPFRLERLARESKIEGDVAVVEEMNLDQRMLSSVGNDLERISTNKDTWVGLFEDAKECFKPLQGAFHIFLMGCATGNAPDATAPANTGVLTQNVASELAGVLKMDVIAYGMSRTATNEELLPFITGIGVITTDAAAAKVLQGSMPSTGVPSPPKGGKALRDFKKAQKKLQAGATVGTANVNRTLPLTVEWRRANS